MYLLGDHRQTGCLIETDLIMNKYTWLFALSPLVVTACGSSNSNSPCGPCSSPDILIRISSNGALVKSMTVSGPACLVNAFEPDAPEYDIQVSSVGECDVNVELENGGSTELLCS